MMWGRRANVDEYISRKWCGVGCGFRMYMNLPTHTYEKKVIRALRTSPTLRVSPKSRDSSLWSLQAAIINARSREKSLTHIWKDFLNNLSIGVSFGTSEDMLKVKLAPHTLITACKPRSRICIRPTQKKKNVVRVERKGDASRIFFSNFGTSSASEVYPSLYQLWCCKPWQMKPRENERMQLD